MGRVGNPVEVRFINGTRKHKLAVVNGYMYERNKVIVSGCSYRCLHYKTCKSILHVLTAGSVQFGDHTHGPEDEQITAREIIDEAKMMVRGDPLMRTAQATGRIEDRIREQGINPVTVGKTSNIKRRIRYTKFKTHGSEDLGKDLATLQIPQNLQKTENGEDFLLYDNNNGESRMIIFASKSGLEKLSYCNVWMVDGTFKTAPDLFYQLYTVHGVYNGVAVPFIYGYLPGKSEQVYQEFFEVVHRKTVGEPEVIISDFEMAAINAIRTEFPITTELCGCLFHLTQNIYRHVKKLPTVLKRYMTSDIDGVKVRTAIRSLGALAFLPPNVVPAAFIAIRGQFGRDDEVRKLFKYFQNTYLGQDWNDCLFPIDFWNVRSRFENGVSRTNNPKEGWHYRFSCQHFRYKPKVGASIAAIRREEEHWRQECIKIAGGVPSINTKKKYRQVEERLCKIISGQQANNFGNYFDFLDNIQRCLHEFVRESFPRDSEESDSLSDSD